MRDVVTALAALHSRGVAVAGLDSDSVQVSVFTVAVWEPKVHDLPPLCFALLSLADGPGGQPWSAPPTS